MVSVSLGPSSRLHVPWSCGRPDHLYQGLSWFWCLWPFWLTELCTHLLVAFHPQGSPYLLAPCIWTAHTLLLSTRSQKSPHFHSPAVPTLPSESVLWSDLKSKANWLCLSLVTGGRDQNQHNFHNVFFIWEDNMPTSLGLLFKTNNQDKISMAPCFLKPMSKIWTWYITQIKNGDSWFYLHGPCERHF